MQHALKHVERPGGSHTALDGKKIQSDQPLLNISKHLLQELLAVLPGFRPALEEYCQSSTVITVPRTFLWKCFELLDLQLQQQHLITRNRDETTQSWPRH